MILLSISWDGVLGLIGALIGVFGAYLVMRHQIKKESEQVIQTEKREKEPLVVPGISNIKDLKFEIGRDLVQNGRYFHELKRFSGVTVPIINGGTTPIFDVRYHYELENLEEFSNIFSKDQSPKDSNPKAYFEMKTKSNLKNDRNHPKNWHEFSYRYKYIKGEIEHGRWVNEMILPYSDVLSVILPGEIGNINLPKFITMVLSYYFEMYDIFYFSDEDSDRITPIIKVNIRYKDYEMVERNFQYRLVLGSYSFSNGILSYQWTPKDYENNYIRSL